MGRLEGKIALIAGHIDHVDSGATISRTKGPE